MNLHILCLDIRFICRMMHKSVDPDKHVHNVLNNFAQFKQHSTIWNVNIFYFISTLI